MRAGHELDPPGQPQDRPFVATCSAGKYAYCRCSRSSRYPLCDGSHRALEDADLTDPKKSPLKVFLDKTETIAWCACGKTSNPPHCDGSHARSRNSGD